MTIVRSFSVNPGVDSWLNDKRRLDRSFSISDFINKSILKEIKRQKNE